MMEKYVVLYASFQKSRYHASRFIYLSSEGAIYCTLMSIFVQVTTRVVALVISLAFATYIIENYVKVLSLELFTVVLLVMHEEQGSNLHLHHNIN